jgi:hypothetical protein
MASREEALRRRDEAQLAFEALLPKIEHHGTRTRIADAAYEWAEAEAAFELAHEREVRMSAIEDGL